METASRDHRAAVALVGGLVVLTAVAFSIAKPLERLSAKTGCAGSNGRWDSDSAVCDYGRGGAVVRLLEQSKRCQDVSDSNLRECAYSVERLHIDVIGVGMPTASVAVDGSDDNLGYGVGVFMGEGCIRVAPGTQLKEKDPTRRTEDGFISTWTGDVYDSMAVCRVDGLAVRRASSPAP